MLVLSRKPQEAIVINDTVRVTVLAISDGRVRLGVAAPPQVAVDRAEVYAQRTLTAWDPVYAALGAAVDEDEFLADTAA